MTPKFAAGVAILCLAAGAAMAAPAAVEYRLAPELEAGKLTALSVEVRLAGDADGETVFSLPNGNSVSPGGAEDVRAVTVAGGSLEDAGGGRLAVRHAPGAPIVVRYQVVGSAADDPPRQTLKPAILPDWFVAHGDKSLLKPEGRDGAPVRLTWSPAPRGWTTVSSLQFQASPTVANVTDSLLVGGAGWSKVRTGGLTFFYRPAGWKTSPALAVPTIARILAGDFAYWGDRPQQLFGVAMQTNGDVGGRGLPAGFMLYAPAAFDLRSEPRLVAHEHTHNWISRKLGYLQDDDDREGWFKEGFTEAVAARSLLRSGAWTTAEFVADLNVALKAYGLSPARTLTNDQIAERRRDEFDAKQIPYNRGRLIAILWDRRVRAASQGRLGLDDVLQAQRKMAAQNAAAGRQVSADKLFPVAYRAVVGEDIAPQVAALVEGGQLIQLTDDLFGACGRFERLEQPSFERGFDFDATLRNNRVLVGLVPGGPAERAGLRDGMRIRINEVRSNDSQIPLTYRVVQPDGSMTPITYKPEGATRTSFQQFRLNAGLDAERVAACRRMFAGQQ
jgi:predicted metalloprotease with PDZ domain